MVDELRPLLFSIAYGMLGSVADAEDVVQDAFLRYHRAVEGGAEIESPKAFLCAVTTNLGIDHLRSARVRRESYVGEWLPEPLVADAAAPDAARELEQADSLSLALLVVLERLSPVERAVFLLHDVFDYGYDEVAALVGKSEANCRQLAVRARRHVGEHRQRFEASRQERDELADRFFDAAGRGDMDGLIGLLAPDVVFHGDGGGKAPAIAGPIYGRERAGKLLAGYIAQARALGLPPRRVEVNGRPGALFADEDGRPISVLAFDIADGAVQAIHSVINPDKLRHLGEPADVRALLRRRRPSEP